MKQLIIFLVVFALDRAAQSQDNVIIKQGSRLQYLVTVNGRTFPMFTHIDTLTDDKFSFTWKFESGRSGRFIMKRPSLDSARFCYWNQPIDGEELLVPPSQGVLVISRLIFSMLQKNKEAVFDEYTVRVRSPDAVNTFKLKDRAVDALELAGGSDTKIWVLNNPQIPLILKIEGNPFGVDVELTEIN